MIPRLLRRELDPAALEPAAVVVSVGAAVDKAGAAQRARQDRRLKPLPAQAQLNNLQPKNSAAAASDSGAGPRLSPANTRSHFARKGNKLARRFGSEWIHE